MKYTFETSFTPLAAFIKSKYPADIDFNARLSKANGSTKVVFIFKSDSIDVSKLEHLFLTSYVNTFNNELQTLRSLVRTLLPHDDLKGK